MVKMHLGWGVTSFVALALALAAGACSSSDSDGGAPASCESPTKACTGPSGCAGTQTCNADGKTYSECVCPAADAAPPQVEPDAGTDTGADAGDWNPRDMAGLMLWLDGSKGVVEDPVKPGKVYKWQDRSGHGNDAIVASSESPTIDANAVNGKGAVKCINGSYLSVADTNTLKFGTGDYGVITIAKATVAANVGPTFFEKGVVAQITGEKSFRLITVQGGGGEAVVQNVPIDTFALYVARGSQMEVRAGGKVGTGPKTTIDISDTNPAYVCRGTVDASTTIAEIMVVKGTLSDADIAHANAYVKAKYGF